MKFLLFLTCLNLLFFGKTVAGEGYVSSNSFTGNWEDDAIWMKSKTWLGNNPGTNIGGATSYVQLYGKITRNGNLSIGGASKLYVNDTLWVNGDLTLGGSGEIIIQNNGVLIVTGDLNAAGGSLSANSGRVIVMGDVDISGGADLNNSEDFYVYGDTSRSGGAKFNGSNNPSASNFGSESDLAADDPSLYVLATGGTLPVTFLFVKVSGSNANVFIKWATASEENNDYFTIQRSVDGKNYQEVARIKGSGNSDGVKEYSYVDSQVVFGTTYYRIKQTDFDGHYDYSRIVKMNTESIGSAESFNVYPNPSQGFVNLDLRSLGTEEVVVTVFNNRGNAVYQNTLNRSLSADNPIDLNSLSKGIYLVEVKSALNVLRKRIVLN